MQQARLREAVTGDRPGLAHRLPVQRHAGILAVRGTCIESNRTSGSPTCLESRLL